MKYLYLLAFLFGLGASYILYALPDPGCFYIDGPNFKRHFYMPFVIMEKGKIYDTEIYCCNTYEKCAVWSVDHGLPLCAIK